MKRNIALQVLALVLGAGAMGLGSQAAVAADTTPVRVPMTVDAADEPRPALRYPLFHDMIDQVPGNAAVAYSRAIRMIVQNEQWKDHATRCSEWLGQPLDQLPESEVSAMLVQHTPALNELIKATRYERCDWEVPIRTEGFAALLPHLSELRSAARLLALDLRWCVRQGRFEDAIARLRAGLTMARHTGDSTLLIEGLVGLAIAQQMLGTVEDFVQQPGAPNLYWALTDLPPAYINLWRATLWERSGVYVEIPVLRDVGKRPITASDLQRALVGVQNLGGAVAAMPSLSKEDQAALTVAGIGWLVYPLARNGLAREGMTAGELDGMSPADILIRYVGGGYARQRDNLFKWFNLPYPEARKGLARAQAEFEQDIARDPIEHIFSRLFLPALGRAADRFAELDRQFAALRCVEAIRCHAARHDRQLPASLDLIQEMPVPADPMTGLPFVYRLEGQTATLQPPLMTEVKARKPKIYEITIRR